MTTLANRLNVSLIPEPFRGLRHRHNVVQLCCYYCKPRLLTWPAQWLFRQNSSPPLSVAPTPPGLTDFLRCHATTGPLLLPSRPAKTVVELPRSEHFDPPPFVLERLSGTHRAFHGIGQTVVVGRCASDPKRDFKTSAHSGVWVLEPLSAVKCVATGFRRPSTPLLEEKGNPLFSAAVAYFSQPLYINASHTRSAFATGTRVSRIRWGYSCGINRSSS